MKIRIVKKPSSLQIEDLKNHLRKERVETNEGFYSNLFESQNPIKGIWIFYENGRYIGFMKRSKTKPVVEIIMFSIDYKRRGNGYGTIVYRKIEKEFKNKGYLAIRLDSLDSFSDKFWKNQGFEKPSQTPYSEINNTLIKIIGDQLNPVNKPNLNNRIELWNVATHLHDRNEPMWIWNINKNQGYKLNPPIIHFCHSEWHLRVIIEGNIVYDWWLKRFNNGNNHINEFLIIEVIVTSKS